MIPDPMPVAERLSVTADLLAQFALDMRRLAAQQPPRREEAEAWILKHYFNKFNDGDLPALFDFIYGKAE